VARCCPLLPSSAAVGAITAPSMAGASDAALLYLARATANHGAKNMRAPRKEGIV
jgi:hypothetical protein